MDILIHDENPYVRAAVARQGYGLDILINDKSMIVREEVAEQGYGLGILVNDEHWVARTTADKQAHKAKISETFEEKLDRLERETELESYDTDKNKIPSQER